MTNINELRAEYSDNLEAMETLTAKPRMSANDNTRFAQLDARQSELAASIEAADLDDKVRRVRLGDRSGSPLTGSPEGRGGGVRVGHEAETYRPDSPHSYFADLISAQRNHSFDAVERLQRHKREVEVNRPEEARDLSRTDTTSVGEFVPPAWLVDQYAPGLRAGRVVADLCQSIPLPGGTDSINIPRISTNATVAAQTADNATVNEVDAVSATVNAPVRTFAGQNDVAIQVLEQSPVRGTFDRVIFNELMADLDRYTDAQVLNGTGANGQILGILQTSGIKTTAYTDASATLPELWPNLSKAVSVGVGARFEAYEAIVMHPRRWYWMTSILDGTTSRPVFSPSAGGPNNAFGTFQQGGQAQGAVGQLLGLPVYLDPNVPITLTNGAGAAGTEDIIIAGKFSDAMLFEGPLRTRVLPDVLSGTLTVRLQVYRYVAFTAARIPVGFSTVYDTGLQGSQISGF